MISRNTIALTPALLIAGIIVQVFALVLIILLWIPCLIWPEILNGPYRWITKAGTRIMVRSLTKNAVRKDVPKTETAA